MIHHKNLIEYRVTYIQNAAFETSTYFLSQLCWLHYFLLFLFCFRPYRTQENYLRIKCLVIEPKITQYFNDEKYIIYSIIRKTYY